MASCKCVSEEFVSKSLIVLPFMKLRFTPGVGGVARGIVGVMESLGRFIVGFDIKDRFCFESHSFVNHCVKKSDFGV